MSSRLLSAERCEVEAKLWKLKLWCLSKNSTLVRDVLTSLSPDEALNKLVEKLLVAQSQPTQRFLLVFVFPSLFAAP